MAVSDYSMFDVQAAKEQQRHKNAYEASQIPLGRGAFYASSVGGDLYNEGLMGLAGLLGGTPDPATAKQQAILEIQERFPDPDTFEEFMDLYNALRMGGFYEFAEQALKAANDIRASMPTVTKDKLPTNIEEYNFAKDQGYDGSYMEFLKAKKAGTTVNVDTSDGSTPGWEAIDKAYATDYLNWSMNSGDMIGQVAQLETVLTKLEAGEDVTGAAKGLMPDWYNYLVNPQVIENKERVAEVVQRNLKLILGGQFSEREGEQLIARAYNPALDEKENISRLKRLILQMKVGINARQKMIEHFDKHGTMKGYIGDRPSIQDFYNAMEGIQPGEIKDGWVFLGGEPSDMGNWKKVEGE